MKGLRLSQYESYHQCPRCGSTAYKESDRGWERYPAKLIFLRKLKCIRCYRYFWRFSLVRPPDTPE